MKIISLINIKGGVGKTVSSVNIAATLFQQGKKVLIVDLDAQSNATRSLGVTVTGENGEHTIRSIFLEKGYSSRNAVHKTNYDGIDVIPSHISFAFSESQIVTDTSRASQMILRKALAELTDDYDYCILDCPPNIGIVTINALVASDFVTVPVKIDQFAIDGLSYLLKTINETAQEFNPAIKYLGAFITMDNSTVVSREVKSSLETIETLNLMPISIKQNVKVVESTFQEPLIFSEPKAVAAINYQELTQELISRMENK